MYSEINIKRNKTIDLFRLIAAFLIVVIHSPVPGGAGVFLESLSRAAVPFFFMVSGFFSFGNSAEVMKKRAKKQLAVLGSSCLFYLIWELLWSIRTHDTLEKLLLFLAPTKLLEAVLLQQGTLLGHLWFLLALVYCYCFIVIVNCSLSSCRALIMGTVLAAVQFGLKTVISLNGVGDTSYYTRNFLLTGLPMFLIGYALPELTAGRQSMRQKRFAVILMTAGASLSLFQRLAIGIADMYFGSIFLAAGAMIFCIDTPLNNEFLSRIGREDTGHVYIFHVVVLNVFNMAGSVLGILQSQVFLYLRPVAVTLMSVLLSRFLICAVYPRCRRINEVYLHLRSHSGKR